MKLKDIRSYLLEGGFNMNITSKYADIVNYKKIGHFDKEKIIIYYDKGTITISGNNMTISKLVFNELLVVGNIKNIELS